MVLFFIMALVAAYASRNLIFEQKTSANTYRSTQAREATEAAIEWVVMQLNAGRISATCEPSANVNDTTFRQRYLTLQDDGIFNTKKWVSNGAEAQLIPSCVRDQNGWACSCPAGANPSPVVPALQPAPAFALKFELIGQPGLVSMHADGCSGPGSAGAECWHSTSVDDGIATTDADAKASVRAKLALVRALPVAPTAALTVGNRIQSTAELVVANDDSKTGVTARAGGVIVAGSLRMIPPAGSTGTGMLASDAALRQLAIDDRLFVSLFGMNRFMFRRQPAAFRLACIACASSDIETAVAGQPGRILWVSGDVDLNNTTTLGSAAEPVFLVVDGTLTVSATVTFNGLLYARDFVWTAPAGAVIVGAAVVENDFSATTEARVAYQAAMLGLIQRGHGSFVRVPGSWWDQD